MITTSFELFLPSYYEVDQIFLVDLFLLIGRTIGYLFLFLSQVLSNIKGNSYDNNQPFYNKLPIGIHTDKR